MNELSVISELCSSKLGALEHFLEQCCTSFTLLAPKYAPDERFDLTLLVSDNEECEHVYMKTMESMTFTDVKSCGQSRREVER